MTTPLDGAPPLRRRRRASKGAPRLIPYRDPRPPGHPTLLAEPKVVEDFLTALRAGNYRSVAAEFAGISPRTVEDWIARAMGHGKRPARPHHIEFFRLVRQAEASAEVLVVGNLVARTKVDYNAAGYWLKNRRPSRWGPVADPESETPRVVDRSSHQTLIVVTPEQLGLAAESLLSAKRKEIPDGSGSGDRLAPLRILATDELLAED